MHTLNTLFVGKVVHNFPSLPSTNEYATNLLAKTKPIEGTVISADYQTAGRGQIGRSWFASAEKNVLLSVILYPKWIAAKEQFSLSKALALAVADTIKQYCGLEAQVKWPNDVYVGDEKIAGILIQNNLFGMQLKSTIVGIGINVNQPSFPDELPNPTSVFLLKKSPIDLSLFKNCLFNNIEKRYLQLKNNTASISKEYLANLYRYQEWHFFEVLATNMTFEGCIIGVKSSGHLAIQNRVGEVKYFDIKSIRFL